jgi:hypothetical protein
MSAVVVTISGVPVNVGAWNFGTSVGGGGSATFDLPASELPFRPGETILIGDAHKALWSGVADRVETTASGQTVWAKDMTAIAAMPLRMAHPAFKYGDVVEYQRPLRRTPTAQRYMVVAVEGDEMTVVCLWDYINPVIRTTSQGWRLAE